jgi:hypothetical protein
VLDVRSLDPVPITVFATPAEDLTVALPEAGTPVLETPVLVPIDLTESHGTDITLARLDELAASYDPEIEMAPLNFDHAYGGPSHGWCEAVWVRDGALWVRYVDLAAEAVDGIRQRRYTRRSAEIVLHHPVTGGWYFTGLALLGNQRPAVLGLPPLQLHRPRHVVITGAPPRKEKQMETPTPAAAEPAAVQLTAAEVEQLRSGVALAAELRRQNAQLQADAAIRALGSRVTPAMKRDLLPLLAHLMAAETPATLKLSVREGDKDVPKDFTVAEVVLRILQAVPEFEALGRGPMAADEGADLEAATGDVAVLYARYSLTPERLTALRARYGGGN